MRKPALLVVAVTAVLVAVPPRSVSGDDVPAVGSAAPSFTLVDNAGGKTSLSDFKGKWVVLYFYPHDFTSICRLEATYFQRDVPKYQQADAVILGVSVDTTEAHKRFCTEEGLSFMLLSDSDAKVSAAYGSVVESNSGSRFAVRNTFVIDPVGKIARTFLKVRTVGHSEEVLSALAELQKQ